MIMNKATQDKRAQRIRDTLARLQKQQKRVTHRDIAEEIGMSKRTVEVYIRDYKIDKPDGRHYTPSRKKRRTHKRR